ncbi:related to fruiting body protein SC7 precursor [Sporisorium reilianum f. sp. reilianum]|uniref:Related to fruiting body protein SC7 n=1 Tax=Sporisorium reilianum f. sp. reilianum TaxID=72559 RepID=A0A2N8UIX2_9BASI|nr:related to fruiting body protein SC7 precursor [Sporisorium reilianum f. sp. reilianum]
MALVAMVFFVLCFSEPASAGRFSHSPRPAHHHIRRALLARCSGADCPEGNSTLGPYVQDQVKKLSSASAQQGGQKMVQNTALPGNTQVHVEAKSDQSGKSRSWSWSWSSHTRSSSSSSSSSNWSNSHPSSSDNDSSHQAINSDDDDDSGNQAIGTPDHHDDGQSKQGQEQEQQPPQQPQPQPNSQPQGVIVHTETKSGHSQHSSISKHSTSSTTEDKDGKVTRRTSNTESSSSSSSSYYSQSSNVFHYVISGNTERWNNAAPFTNPHVEWTRSSAKFSISSASGPHIDRPARADTCNQKFPFTSQQLTASDKEPRFTKPFPKEALDPVSKIALDLHNAERARYGLPLLQWNAELANMASCWADLKAYGHSEDHFCASGENIAMGLGNPCYSNPMEGMKNAVYSFLDEDRNWAQNPHMTEANGHWTQIVWKETRFVGCAVSQRKDFMDGYDPNDDQASMYVVCEYYPPGNVEGQFDRQVPLVRPMPQLRSICSANERHGS